MSTALYEVAACLWEAVLEIKERPVVKAAFELNGTSAVRWNIISLADQCEADWLKVADTFDGCFDWDFVPKWLDDHFDWETLPYA